ncbi:hypothetical protein MMC22_003518 [Lobaria immixta]|nr:hypothetical protein [Lobaria immixta]
MHEAVNIGVIGAFFGLALIMATARTVIRVQKFGRVFVDDYFFFLAVVCLIASNGIYFWMVPSVYNFAAMPARLEPLPADFIKSATLANIAYVPTDLAWTTVFAVKFSFLFFFRNLIRRLRNLEILWWCVLVACVPVAIVCICMPGKCLDGPTLARTIKVVYYSMAADIGTDVLVISIPISLLWKTRFDIGQKLSIGITLCLSVVMIAICLARGASATTIEAQQIPIWNNFWIQIESCVSVMMVCITAFRTLVVSARTSKKALRYYKRLPNKQRLWRERKGEAELPEIPICVTMTGMRTMIRENGNTVMGSFAYDDPTLSKKDQESVAQGHGSLTLATSHENGATSKSWA